MPTLGCSSMDCDCQRCLLPSSVSDDCNQCQPVAIGGSNNGFKLISRWLTDLDKNLRSVGRSDSLTSASHIRQQKLRRHQIKSRPHLLKLYPEDFCRGYSEIIRFSGGWTPRHNLRWPLPLLKLDLAKKLRWLGSTPPQCSLHDYRPHSNGS